MKIKIKVKPNSKKQEIIKKDNFYLVKLKSVPENNKANLELMKILHPRAYPERNNFSTRGKIF